MPTNCSIKWSLLVALAAVALLLSAAAAAADFSGGRTGGRMGGSRKAHIVRPSRRSSHLNSFHRPLRADPPLRHNQYHRFERQGQIQNKKKESNYEKYKSVSVNSHRWFALPFGLAIVACVVLYLGCGSNEARVLMVQAGLSGSAKSLQRDLNRIARSTNTDDEAGFHQVLSETVTVLLSHQNHWISGFSYLKKNINIEESEKSFKQLSLKERKKVDLESLVNVNGVREERISKHRANNLEKSFIVVTVIVAAQGEHKLPAIKAAKDLRKALQYLSAISLDQTLAVEVLWTPQHENDMMSEDEFLENYHCLRPI